MKGGAALRVPLPAGARTGLPASLTTGGASPSPATSRTASSSGWANRDRGRPPVAGVRLDDVLGPAIAGRGRARSSPRRSRAAAARAPRAPTVPADRRRGDGGQGLADGHLPGPPPHAARRGPLRALRAGTARRRGRRGRDGDSARGAGALHRRRALARRAVPPRRALEGARSRRGCPTTTSRARPRSGTRRGSRWRRSRTCRSRTRSRARACRRARARSPGSRSRRRRSSGSRRSTAATRRRRCQHRERVMTLAAPFAAAPSEVTRLEQRFAGLDWTGRPGVALVTEYDRDRRWRTTSLVDLAAPAPRRSSSISRPTTPTATRASR